LPEPLRITEWNEELEKYWQTVLMSSPDGEAVMTFSQEFLDSLDGFDHHQRQQRSDLDCIVADKPLRCKIELKCPYGERDPNGNLWSKFKYYYYGQCQYHLLTDPKAAFCLSGCWTPATTRLWMIPRNRDYWSLALPFVVYFHRCGQLQIAPSTAFYEKRAGDIATLKAMCDNGVEDQAIHLGDYASVYSMYREKQLEELWTKRFPSTVAAH
jgi:hypothetical protein